MASPRLAALGRSVAPALRETGVKNALWPVPARRSRAMATRTALPAFAAVSQEAPHAWRRARATTYARRARSAGQVRAVARTALAVPSAGSCIASDSRPAVLVHCRHSRLDAT